MISALASNPILLLFIVASIGYLLGSFKLKGNSLGVAGVLFTGLAFGAISDEFKIPAIVFNLGLVLYVYSIGLSSGPAFFKSYKKNGLRDFGFIMVMLIFSGLVAVGIFLLFGMSAATITGIYSGSTTNTPALVGVIDYINNTYDDAGAVQVNEGVIGYSLSYPMGVLGGIIAIIAMERFLKVDYNEERRRLRKDYPSDKFLSSSIVEITNDKLDGLALRDIVKDRVWDVRFSRIIRNEEVTLANYDLVIRKGDLVMIIGPEEEVEKAVVDLGRVSKSHLEFDRSQFDVKRIFVSNPDVVGHKLSALNLNQKYHAVISRIRRGDLDLLARDDTILELGDRVRFIARREDLRALSEYFGDSYFDSSKVNIFSFGLGIGLGLLLGMIEIPLGDLSFKLGYAGGPLIVGLILGAIRRTGKLVWTLPYSSTITLQQIGLIMLLAGIGINSGSSFVNSLNQDAILIILASVIISLFTAIGTLWIGYKIVKLPFSILMGMVSNQPAILDFAMNRSENSIPQYGYTMIFPIAAVMKIIIAQLMFILLSS